VALNLFNVRYLNNINGIPRKMINKNILLGLFLTSILVGCGKNHYERFTLEQDGEIKLITFQEFEGIQTTPQITQESLSIELEYAELFEYEQETENEKNSFDSHQQLASDNGGTVNNSVYQYIMAIPVKSDRNIYFLPTQFSSRLYRQKFLGERCTTPYQGGRFFLYFIPDAEIIKGSDGLLHYNLYLQSNEIASRYMLNNIGDLCIKYFDIEGSDLGDSYDIQSNVMTIKAQEIKDTLGSAGILHE
jgi:hypothetical protein